ncbi:MAG: type 1 glutamine amidotransferase [Solirubrobacteraceae bacterium]
MLSKPGVILQHGEDGPPARLGAWLRERALPFVTWRSWVQPPPDPSEHSFVVSLGAEQSANDSHPQWVPDEIETLRRAVAAEVPVLGVCFGGQALSLALGGGCDVLDRPEIGWVAVDSDDESVPAGPWLQYHFEQLRVPPGARELARSPAGPAAFRHGRHLGVQFHPEADAPLLELWARTDPKLPETGITPEQLAAQSDAHAAAALPQAFALFDGWLAGILDNSHNVFSR